MGINFALDDQNIVNHNSFYICVNIGYMIYTWPNGMLLYLPVRMVWYINHVKLCNFIVIILLKLLYRNIDMLL